MVLDFEEPIHAIEQRLEELTALNKDPGGQFRSEIAELTRNLEKTKKAIYSNLTPWQAVQVARHPERPLLQDYTKSIFSEFLELHGDRCYHDDRALIGGFATIEGQRVMLLGMEKGRTIEEKVAANFGMSGPEGYRKALRLMRLAQKYSLPVVSLVDTPAAYPGREAEERGQAEAIARNLTEMASLEVPIVVVVTGEGGSGGALGIAVGDVVLMLSNAIYSVIPPEGCAAILWRDAAKAPEAAAALKITAPSLLESGVVDEVVPEPWGGAHRDPQSTFDATRNAIVKHLVRLKKISSKKLVEQRFEKYNRIGKFDNRKYTQH